MDKPAYIVEACVETFDDALRAEENGADQIELCSRLDLDGLTPDREVVDEVLKKVNIPVKVMIRSRGGDFSYTWQELGEMKDQITSFLKMGVTRFVFGMTLNGQLDLDNISDFINHCEMAEITIHKAIDQCNSPIQELERLKKLQTPLWILSSGGSNSALEGAPVLKEMIHSSGPNIDVIAAGGITRDNLPEIHRLVKGHCYHGRQIV